MKSTLILAISCIASSLMPFNAHAGLFGPSNYEECILASMKGVTSDVAARAISLSCRSKFAEKGPADVEVPDAVAAKLAGRASAKHGFLSASFYNGNEDWTIAQVTVLLAQQKANDEANIVEPKAYNIRVRIAPLTEHEVTEIIDNRYNEKFSWTILKVRGYKTSK